LLLEKFDLILKYEAFWGSTFFGEYFSMYHGCDFQGRSAEVFFRVVGRAVSLAKLVVDFLSKRGIIVLSEY